MIINPSAHPVIPRMNSVQRSSLRKAGHPMAVPGGKQLWSVVVKILPVTLMLVFFSSLWLGSYVVQVNSEIEALETEYQELMNANIVLRAQRARHFSPDAVGSLAAEELAIFLPVPDQYRKF